LEIEERLKRLDKLLEQLRPGWVFVEGKRDKHALEKLGIRNILTISGNLRQSCERLEPHVDKVYVLTDLDRRGDELAKAARDELEGLSFRADLEMRKRLAHTLRIRCFEDAKRAYDELKEEGEKYG
jgi:5S rRNA maturation endonuclease (ribonuclease M5)